MIPGLSYIPDFISEDEEKDLITHIDAQKWRNDLRRLVQHYGYKYDYTKRLIDHTMKVGDIPPFFDTVKKRAAKHFDKDPNQVIVNEYQPGQGINPHVDCIPCFGRVVASLSLLSPCTIEFKGRDGKYNFWLKPRSLLVLADDARYKWSHAIPIRHTDIYNDEVIERKRRVSITFRTVILND